MEEDRIKAGNELIAKSMGLHYDNGDWRDEEGVIHSLYELQGGKIPYDSCWGYLMPVVEYICRLKIGDGKKYVDYAYPRTFGMLNEGTNQIMVRFNGMQLKQADTLIQATWESVVDFFLNGIMSIRNEA